MRIALVALVLVCAVSPRALAQEVTTEQSEVRHIYDDAAPWEGVADVSVRLHAPDDFTICRQGRVVMVGGIREAHMGCWPERDREGVRRMAVPDGPAFIGIRHDLDLEWIGGAALSLHDGDVLVVERDDRTVIRIIGWILTAAALASAVGLGAAMIANALPAHAEEIAGFCISGAAVFLGFALALLEDGTGVSVLGPGTPPP